MIPLADLPAAVRAKLPRLGPASPLLEKPRGPRRDDEHQHQVRLFEWADDPTTRAAHPELALLFAIPNFAGRMGRSTARHGARLKAEGRKRGVPDICLPVARGKHHGLYLELKTPTGSPTAEQRAWRDALRQQGYRAEIVRGWEAARDLITRYLTA